jgi:NTE family protein
MGAHEIGMLRALLEHGIKPDLVVGTSIGALNGAGIAAEPSLSTVDKLETIWFNLGRDLILGNPIFSGAANVVRRRSYLQSSQPLRDLLERMLPAKTFEELQVPFHCVAANIERAQEHWFSQGPLIPAILASAAVPGLLPVVEINGEHFMDGGIVNSIPIERAIQLSATELYVLHVGRVEHPLAPPRNLVQTAVIAFEIARRHRFFRDMASLPEGVTAHVLPTGEREPPGKYDALSQLRYRDVSAIRRRIARAHRATSANQERLTEHR